jgi:hypothetical protein
MARHKNPEFMTAEDEIRSLLDWARRTGHLNIAAALERALAKLPAAAMTNDPTTKDDAAPRRRTRRAVRRKPPDEVRIIAGITKGRKPRRRSKPHGAPPAIEAGDRKT